MPVDRFRINLQVICSYHLTDECKGKISAFLMGVAGKFSGIPELFEEYLSRKDQSSRIAIESNLPHGSKWRENFKDGKTLTQMIKTMEEGSPDIVDDGHKINWYWFPHYHRDLATYDVGVILNQDVDLDHEVDSHQPYFRYFFGYILGRTNWPEKFLTYHFETTFKASIDGYRIFISLLDLELFSNRIDFLEEWKQANLVKAIDQKGGNKSTQPKRNLKPATFKSYFENHNKIKSTFKDFIFDARGNVKGKSKPKRLQEAAICFRKRIGELGHSYSAPKAAEVFHTAFGKKLGNEISTLRSSFDPSELDKFPESDTIKSLSELIKDIS